MRELLELRPVGTDIALHLEKDGVEIKSRELQRGEIRKWHVLINIKND